MRPRTRRRPGHLRFVAAGLTAVLVALGTMGGHLLFSPVPLVRTVVIGAASGGGLTPLSVVVEAQTRHIFVANAADNMATMLDADSGAILRHVALGAAVGSATTPLALAVDPQRGRIFVGGQGIVWLLDATSGALRRTIPSVTVDAQGLAVDERSGHLMVAGAGTLTVFDVRRAAPLYSLSIGPVSSRLYAAAFGALGVVASQRDRTVSLVDLSTGQVRRRVLLDANPAHSLTSLVIDPDTARAYVGVVGGAICVIALRQDHPAWTWRLGGAAGIPIVAAVVQRVQRIVVLGATADRISFLDERNGRTVSTSLAGTWPYVVAIDQARARTFVADMNGVAIYDTRRGWPRRRLPLSGLPYAITVDERTGHVFVAKESSLAPPADPWQVVRTWLPWLPFLRDQASPTTRGAVPTVTLLDAPRL